jgi:hypothetical protein
MWKERIETILHLHGVHGHIDGTNKKPEVDDDEIDQWDKEDYIARTLILINIKDDQVVHVSHVKSVQEAWNNLRTIHETRSQSSALIAKRTFYSLKAEEEDDLSMHITDMINKRNELDIMGCEIPDHEFKAMLVMSLPKSWENWTSSYLGAHADKGMESDKIKGYTAQELMSIIINEFNRRKKNDTQEKGYYAKAETNGKKRKVEKKLEKPDKGKNCEREKCRVCGRTNHPTDNCRWKGKPKCNKCGKFGHEVSKRWWNKPGMSSGKGKQKEAANIACDDEDSAFMVDTEDVPMNENEEANFSAYSWVADSGTTSHIVNQRSAFKVFIPEYKKITGIGNTVIEAHGRGMIEMKSRMHQKDIKVTLNDVLYVPTAINNLFSLTRVDEKGGHAIIGNGQITVLDKDRQILACGKHIKRLLLLDAQTIHQTTKNSNTIKEDDVDNWEIWHKKYGHIGISGLQRLLKGKLVDGFNVDENLVFPDCEACIQAKHEHNPFPKQAEHRSEIPGELTHTDVWGKSRVTSILGMQYYITFIDDCTRRCTIKYMKTKDEASEKVKEYLTYIERRWEKLPKRLRADNGTEYINKNLISWCNQKGIDIEVTAPYSPPQNGVAERLNKTLLALSRAMLIAKNCHNPSNE